MKQARARARERARVANHRMRVGACEASVAASCFWEVKTRWTGYDSMKNGKTVTIKLLAIQRRYTKGSIKRTSGKSIDFRTSRS
jgi:hypothetical protein